MIQIENKKLVELLTLKETLVKEGRKISSELETLEFKIVKFQDKEKAITEKISPKELIKEVEVLGKIVEDTIGKIEKISAQIQAQKLAGVPEKMKTDHFDLMKQREEKERERNKIAMKIQKIKDKAVPIIKKEVKPLLAEYDDIETATVKNGKVYVTTFNYLVDFKNKFNK